MNTAVHDHILVTQNLTNATAAIKEAGTNAGETAKNFNEFGQVSEKALGVLKSDLDQAKQKLQAFSTTVFTDEKANTWVGNGTPVISTTQSKFGGASGRFSKNNYISTGNMSGFLFGATEDFTVEAWLFVPTGASIYQQEVPILCIGAQDVSAQGGGWNFALFDQPNATIRLERDGTNGSALAAQFTIGSALPRDTWMHAEFGRSAGMTYGFFNGNLVGTTDSIPWDVAKAVYYRKSSVDPIQPQPKPEYVGSTDLNFICLCSAPDPHNLVLNFGANDCIPSLAPVDWWYIVNDLKVTRLDNEQEIQVNNGNYRCDRGSWCWSYNLTIPFYEKSELDPVDGQPVILKIMINGNEHRMLLENISRSKQFAKDVYRLSGRSPTALLDAPYSPTRSFTQENERTSVQLVQAELDRVNSDIILNWELIDALGWVLPANSLSYLNLTPIAAIKQIVNAAGGFIYSEPDSNTLTIKPLYKKTFWDPIDISDYDRVIPETLVIDLSTDYAMYPDYNGVFLTNDRNGDTGQVRRVGTAGDVLQESINNPLFTSVSAMHEKGRAVLAKAGMVESHSLLMPVSAQVGLCTPGELIAFNGDWWGVGDGVSGSFSHDVVNQTVSVERVNRE